jgi:hypothetical protein
MRTLFVLVLVAVALRAQTVCAEEVSPEKILKYFPGTWEWSRSDGESGRVQWRLVAGRKAIAGPGMTTMGGRDFGLGGWECEAEQWAHTWYSAKGGYGRLVWTKFEEDTYHGVVRTREPGGDFVEAKASCKIVDPDTFIFTVEPDRRATWKRVTQAPAK